MLCVWMKVCSDANARKKEKESCTISNFALLLLVLSYLVAVKGLIISKTREP